MDIITILGIILSIPGCIVAVIELAIFIKKFLDKK